MQTPGFLQSLEEQVGAAEEQNFRRGGIPTSQSGQVLINDSLEKRCDDFIDGHAGLQQSVRVGFREDSALAADLVQRVPRVAHFRKLFGWDLQLAGRLFNKGSRAARAGALHQDLLALCFSVAVEEDRLHAFAADFTDEMHRRVKFFYACGNSYNFLNDFPSCQGSDEPGTGSGEEDAIVLGCQAVLGFETGKKLQNFFRLLGVVALIRLGNDFAVSRGKRVFAGGASHVDAADLGAVTFGPIRLRSRDLNAAWRLQKRRDLDKSLVGH